MLRLLNERLPSGDDTTEHAVSAQLKANPTRVWILRNAGRIPWMGPPGAR
jgi:hypothetical protein